MPIFKSGLFKKAISSGRRFVDLVEILGILWSKERRYTTQLSLLKRLRAWRLGFFSDTYVQYFADGDDRNHKLYLSDFSRWYYIPWVNAKYGILLSDKFLFYRYFEKFKDRIPEIYFLISSGKLHNTDLIEVDTFELIKQIKCNSQVILKPRIGFGGRGILKASYKDDYLIINDAIHSPESFVEFVLQLENYIVCSFVDQKGYANEIYPFSVNTLRVLTVIDPVSNQARIAGIAHRFGSKTTGNVDNWTGGGLSAAVDISSGRIGNCARNPKGMKLEWIESHPDTGTEITGRLIPNWDNLITEILQMATFCKFCTYIGWDVAVSENEFWILEANDSPDVHILQIHEPLFKDPQNQSFFKYHFNRLDVSFH
jgi:hypothetical protein